MEKLFEQNNIEDCDPAPIPEPNKDDLVFDILYSNRLDYLLSMNTIDSKNKANIEALFATSCTLLKLGEILNKTGILTSQTKIPQLFAQLGLAVVESLKRFQAIEDNSNTDQPLQEEDFKEILNLLSNVNLKLPEGL